MIIGCVTTIAWRGHDECLPTMRRLLMKLPFVAACCLLGYSSKIAYDMTMLFITRSCHDRLRHND